MALNALDLIDAAIADLEAELNLPPGGTLPTTNATTATSAAAADGKSTSQATTTNDKPKQAQPKKPKKQKQPNNNNNKPKNKGNVANLTQPEICKLEFKVGQITKVWVHPDADKLYCEEIEIGEDKPRQIASGLRPHYTLEEMEGQRLLVVSNLKTKKLAGFPSQGMVLCASTTCPETNTEKVEFIEPPTDAPLGETITFTDLPQPEPFSGAQVEKKKVFQACLDGMKTTEAGEAAWNGHLFMTSKGVCRSRSIKNGAMR